MSSPQNKLALHFASLHKSGSPVILPNVYDCITTQAVLSLRPQVKAVATASYAIASSLGEDDNSMSMDDHLAACRRIKRSLESAEKELQDGEPGVPFTVDIINGYDSELRTAITKIIQLGAVGCNIEDSRFDPATKKHSLFSIEEMQERLRTAQQVAAENGVPDFVFNVRCDAVLFDPANGFEEIVKRGTAYLETKVPTTIFVWGGPFGPDVTPAQLKSLVERWGGKVSTKVTKGKWSVQELAEAGVSRVSIGPYMAFMHTEHVKAAAKRILDGGVFSFE